MPRWIPAEVARRARRVVVARWWTGRGYRIRVPASRCARERRGHYEGDEPASLHTLTLDRTVVHGRNGARRRIEPEPRPSRDCTSDDTSPHASRTRARSGREPSSRPHQGQLAGGGRSAWHEADRSQHLNPGIAAPLPANLRDHAPHFSPRDLLDGHWTAGVVVDRSAHDRAIEAHLTQARVRIAGERRMRAATHHHRKYGCRSTHRVKLTMASFDDLLRRTDGDHFEHGASTARIDDAPNEEQRAGRFVANSRG